MSVEKPWFEVMRYIGGEFVESGIGRDGVYAREFFTEAKNVCLSNQ
jgi:hypothetical protein